MRTIVTALVAFLIVLAGCQGSSTDYLEEPADPEWLHESVWRLSNVMVNDIFSPPLASRTYAYSSIAAYEVMRHEQSGYHSLAGQLNELTPVPEPNPEAEIYLPLAGVHAFLSVASQLVFSQEMMRSFHTEMLDRIRERRIPRSVFDESLQYGQEVADHILAWAREDYYLETRGYPRYTVEEEPGRWIPTPPAYLDAVEPNWHLLRPMAMDSSGQFRPDPPVPFSMEEGSPFYRQVMDVYDAVRHADSEEREIAAFWDCNPYALRIQGHAKFAKKNLTPGGHWMGIAAIAARETNADMLRAAETYAMTGITLYDAFMSSWEEKYRSLLIRPETVINRHFDESWTPILQTPPFPEYTSGHSVISTAAATVLTELYGEPFAYDDTTNVSFGLPVRSFNSFREASEEAAVSRFYGGIHYMMAVEEGVDQGRNVGQHILDRIVTREPILANE